MVCSSQHSELAVEPWLRPVSVVFDSNGWYTLWLCIDKWASLSLSLSLTVCVTHAHTFFLFHRQSYAVFISYFSLHLSLCISTFFSLLHITQFTLSIFLHKPIELMFYLSLSFTLFMFYIKGWLVIYYIILKATCGTHASIVIILFCAISLLHPTGYEPMTHAMCDPYAIVSLYIVSLFVY